MMGGEPRGKRGRAERRYVRREDGLFEWWCGWRDGVSVALAIRCVHTPKYDDRKIDFYTESNYLFLSEKWIPSIYITFGQLLREIDT